MPCFYVTNSVYMEQKPETGKSTDKTKNNFVILAPSKQMRKNKGGNNHGNSIFCAAGMSTSLLVKKMEEASKGKKEKMLIS